MAAHWKRMRMTNWDLLFFRYEYRTADAFLKDFELMKSNAIKFNGKDIRCHSEQSKGRSFVMLQGCCCMSL